MVGGFGVLRGNCAHQFIDHPYEVLLRCASQSGREVRRKRVMPVRKGGTERGCSGGKVVRGVICQWLEWSRQGFGLKSSRAYHPHLVEFNVTISRNATDIVEFNVNDPAETLLTSECL